jgi:hypothetical protein
MVNSLRCGKRRDRTRSGRIRFHLYKVADRRKTPPKDSPPAAPALARSWFVYFGPALRLRE